MSRQLISSGSTFEQEIGYSRAVVAGDWVMVSGTTGFDYSNMTISNDLLVQAEQCFQNIEGALKEASSSLKRCGACNLCISRSRRLSQMLASHAQIFR